MGASRELAELASAYNAGGSLGFRNRIINGDMRIDQRNNGASVSFAGTGAYTLDRWLIDNTTDGTISVQQSSVAPTGFTNSLLVTVTTADASLSSTQRCRVRQPIEGFNVADLGFGAAGAQSVTLSFWVRSSLTGTFGGALNNSAVDRSYPFSYTISAANTWEYKTVTIAGDTSGTWLTNSGIGLTVQFGLGIGSSFSGTAGAWAASQIMAPTGATSVVGTNGATFYITGVQLEAGSVATPFERRDYGRELMMCQRYYQTQSLGGLSAPNISNAFLTTFPLKVEMRASPTATFDAVSNYQPGGGSGTPSAGGLTTTSLGQINIGSGNTSFNAQIINSACIARISAEL